MPMTILAFIVAAACLIVATHAGETIENSKTAAMKLAEAPALAQAGRVRS